MSTAMPVSVAPLGAVHSALVCANTSGGQVECTGTSFGLFNGFGIVLLFIYLAVAVLGIVAAVKVVSKAGYSGWWVLITIVPIVGSVFVLVFAFSTWPITQEVQMLRNQAGRGGGFGGPGGYGGYGGPPNPAGPGLLPLSSPQVVPAGTAPEEIPIPSFGQFIRGETASADSASTGSSAPPSGTPAHPPAGWFPSPGGPPGQHRYWDGSSWTDHYREGTR